MTDLEIICVDDCSSDNSVDIVLRHKANDDRIVLVRNEANLGSGGARNAGIRAANSNFIAFVDSDDSIDSEMMQILWDATENGKFDVIACGFERANSSGVRRTKKFDEKVILASDGGINIFRSTNIEIWNKLWRKNLFVEYNIYFPNNTYYVDAATTPRLLHRARNVRTIKEVLYVHREREGSISFSTSPQHIIDYFKVYDILYDYLSNYGLLDVYSEEMLAYIDRTISYHARSAISKITDEQVELQALRHLLAFKLGYVENRTHLYSLSKKKILKLLRSGSDSIKTSAELKNQSNSRFRRIFFGTR